MDNKHQLYEDLAVQFARYPEHHYDKNKILLEPSQQIEYLYFLKKGQLRLFIMSPSGEEITIHIYRSPAIVPMMLLLSKAEEIFFFETHTPATVVKIPLEAELDNLLHNTLFMQDLATRFAAAINGLTKRVYIMASVKQKEQLFNLLSYLQTKANDSVENKQAQGLQVTHSEIANWLGCARETVTRLLKQLEEEKRIMYKEGLIKVTEHQS